MTQERLRCTKCTKWYSRNSCGRKRPICDRCEPPKPRRKFDPAKVGDVYGSHRVEELLARDSTSNERVRVRCLNCGNEKPAYVFNLRTRSKCMRCARKVAA